MKIWGSFLSANFQFNDCHLNFFLFVCSGTLSLKDVFDSANKESDVKLSEVENSLQFDDPVNIQFTSVSKQIYLY